ncbi:MAG TPA: PAS domain S-box protein, partial [Flavobacterium sp.]
IGQAIIATDIKGTVNYWSRSAEKMYGWSREDAMGQNIMSLTPAPEAREMGLEIMEKLAKGESWSGEFDVTRKDGTTFPAYVTNSPIYSNKKLIGIIGISADITEKKNLEKLLDRANRLARNGMYEVDLMTNKLYWSDITREIHEVPKDFVPDIQTAIGFYKEGFSRKAITQALMTAMADGTPWDMELEIITAKGNERWVRAIGEADFDSGKCVRIAGSFQDIHQQKITEIEYRELAEEKNEILECIGDAFFSVDNNWLITYFNKKAEGALEVKRDDVIGKNLWNVFPLAVNTIFDKEYHIAKTKNVDRTFEAFYAPLAGWFDVSAYPSQRGLSIYFKRNKLKD